MGKKQILGLIGSILLFIGVFAPIVSVPIVGGVNYFRDGQGDGVIVAVLAIASLLVTLFRKYRVLWFTGLGSLGTMLFSFIHFQLMMAQARSDMERELAGNPFKGLGELALGSVQLEWGWAVLLVGVVCILAAAAIRDEASDSFASEFSFETLANRQTRNRSIMIALGGLVMVGFIFAAVSAANFLTKGNRGNTKTLASQDIPAAVAVAKGYGEGIRAALAAFAADSPGNYYPTTIPGYSALANVVNSNGGLLKETESAMGFKFLSYHTDTDAKGGAVDYHLELGVIGIPKNADGYCIAVRPAVVEECSAENLSTSGEQEPKWRTFSEKSPIDDSTNVYLAVDAKNPVSGWLNENVTPSLHVRCKEDKTNTYINLGMRPQTDYGSYGVEYAYLTLRFDDEKAYRARFDLSTDGEAVFFEKHIPTIKKMLKHKKVLVKFTPFNSSPQLTEFDLAGLDDAISPLRKACHW